METNRVQKHICDFIIEQVVWWTDSDDIDSPTHLSELEDRLNDLVEDEGWIDGTQACELLNRLTDLLTTIRQLKD